MVKIRDSIYCFSDETSFAGELLKSEEIFFSLFLIRSNYFIAVRELGLSWLISCDLSPAITYLQVRELVNLAQLSRRRSLPEYANFDFLVFLSQNQI